MQPPAKRSRKHSGSKISKSRKFERIASDCSHEIRIGYRRASREVKVTDLITQKDPWKYLDLAMKNPVAGNWETAIRNLMYRFLPYSGREYFMENITNRSGNLFDKVWMERISHFKFHLEVYPPNISTYFPAFERKFKNRINSVKDRELRRVEMYRYLKMCTLCEIRVDPYEMLLNLCSSPPLDSQLILEIANTVLSDERSRKFVFVFVPDENCLEALLSRAKLEGFDFWGIWPEQSGIRMNDRMNPVLDFMCLRKKNSFAKVLLKHGFRFADKRSVFKRKILEIQISSVYHNKRTIEGLKRCKIENLRRLMLIFITFASFADLYKTGDITGNISTLVCLFRSIPDPYVTPIEMYNGLEGSLISRVRTHLMRACEEYMMTEIFHKEKYHVYQPRRLAHLCRCKIRDVLADNMKLPNGIGQLDVSQELTRYLELKT